MMVLSASATPGSGLGSTGDRHCPSIELQVDGLTRRRSLARSGSGRRLSVATALSKLGLWGWRNWDLGIGDLGHVSLHCPKAIDAV